MELLKTYNYYFAEYYENINKKNIKVMCILDDDCVRFVACKKDKRNNDVIIYKHEFKNDQKLKCFKLATRYLNK